MGKIVKYEEEVRDSMLLAEAIRKDGWVDSSTVIVCCRPSHSSISSQIINHHLSCYNHNELYEQLLLEMPSSSMNQVWNRETRDYELYDRYLRSFITSLHREWKYLFLSSTIEKPFSLLQTMLRTTSLTYKIGSVYLSKSAPITPDYHIQEYDNIIDFPWQNPFTK